MKLVLILALMIYLAKVSKILSSQYTINIKNYSWAILHSFFHAKSSKSGINSTLTSHLTLERSYVKGSTATCLVATMLDCTGLWDLWRKRLKKVLTYKQPIFECLFYITGALRCYSWKDLEESCSRQLKRKETVLKSVVALEHRPGCRAPIWEYSARPRGPRASLEDQRRPLSKLHPSPASPSACPRCPRFLPGAVPPPLPDKPPAGRSPSQSLFPREPAYDLHP